MTHTWLIILGKIKAFDSILFIDWLFSQTQFAVCMQLKEQYRNGTNVIRSTRLAAFSSNIHFSFRHIMWSCRILKIIYQQFYKWLWVWVKLKSGKQSKRKCFTRFDDAIKCLLKYCFRSEQTNRGRILTETGKMNTITIKSYKYVSSFYFAFKVYEDGHLQVGVWTIMKNMIDSSDNFNYKDEKWA